MAAPKIDRDAARAAGSATRRPGPAAASRCFFCKSKVDEVDYKNVNELRRYVSEKGKIRSRRISGACRRHQRQVAVAVKRARELALLPYVGEQVGRRMEVILKQDVDSLGLRGEVVNVARGYARNFLLPRGLAEVATPALVRELEKRDAQRARHEAKSVDEARAIATRLEALELRFDVNAGPTGSLFGSVTATNVADRLWEQEKIRVDRRKLADGDDQADRPLHRPRSSSSPTWSPSSSSSSRPRARSCRPRRSSPRSRRPSAPRQPPRPRPSEPPRLQSAAVEETGRSRGEAEARRPRRQTTPTSRRPSRRPDERKRRT